MGSKLDAVIAALRVALYEAEQSDEFSWSAETANRWVRQLPGAWWGRWRRLMLRSESGMVRRDLYIGHVRATLAYLEECSGRSSFWSGRQIRTDQVKAFEVSKGEVQKRSSRLLN